MKNYLNYQSSEYDCGSVSITNGIRYLFDREEISPDILKCIMLYTMDTYNEQGQPCRHGTSAAAMRFVGSWLNQLAAVRSFPIQTQFLFGNDVTLSPRKPNRRFCTAQLSCCVFFLKFRIMCF